MSINFSINNNQLNHRVNTFNNINNLKLRNSKSFDTVSFKSSKVNKDVVRVLDDTISNIVHSDNVSLATKMKFHKILNKALPEILCPENFINNGRESKVYRISDDYVVKIKRGIKPTSAIHFIDRTTLPNSKFKNLNFYYGAPVIKIGKTEILKNASSKDSLYCGINYNKQFSLADEIKKYEEVVLPKTASLPQESYDEFADGLKDLNKLSSDSLFTKSYYTPDIMNPNNIIISDNKFKLVDKFDKTLYEEPNSVYTMLEPLLIRLSPEKIAGYNEKLVPQRTEILQKTLIASEKNNLPLDSLLKYPSSNFVLSDIIRIKSNKDIQNTAELIHKLQELRDYGTPLNKRIEFINKALKQSGENM